SNQVSTQAWSCPKCGAPIAARNAPPVVAPPDDKRPVTVEQTSKSIKLGILLCSVAFWIGLITAFSADTPQQSQGPAAWTRPRTTPRRTAAKATCSSGTAEAGTARATGSMPRGATRWAGACTKNLLK